MKKDYMEIYYSEKEKPKTSYPFQLSKYIIKRFYLKASLKILDLGCGRGDFLEVFKSLGFHVAGVDSSKATLEKLSGLYEVKLCDLKKDKIPYSDNSFDLIFSKSVLEHLENPENYFVEIYRILKPHGRVLILTPDWYSQYKVFYNDFTHQKPYTQESLGKMLLYYGFKDVRVEYFYQLPILWKLPVLKIISFLIRFFWPKHIRSSIKSIRFSVELMLLGTGIK